jgi:hypothetical protein
MDLRCYHHWKRPFSALRDLIAAQAEMELLTPHAKCMSSQPRFGLVDDFGGVTRGSNIWGVEWTHKGIADFTNPDRTIEACRNPFVKVVCYLKRCLKSLPGLCF